MRTPPLDPLLVEAAISAWRPRDADRRVRPHPTWCDLSPERSAQQSPRGVSSSDRRLQRRFLGPAGLAKGAGQTIDAAPNDSRTGIQIQ